MNQTEIINLAFLLAGTPTASESVVDKYKTIYTQLLSELLSERDWLFTLNKTNKLNPIKVETDLGYSFTYQLPSDAIGVLIPKSNQMINVNPQEALRMGYTVSRIGLHQEANDYIFLNGVLHSNSELTEVVYRRRVPADRLPAEFRALLINKIAVIVARSVTKDFNIADRLASEIPNLHKRAIRDEISRPSDPFLAGLYDWLHLFYRGNL